MPAPRDDRGSGLVGTLAGMAMFGVLLMVAVNVLVHLHATSAVTAVTFDAARTVAHAPDANGRMAAVAAARQLLGAAGNDTTFDWSGSTSEIVRLHVDAPGPHLLPVAVLRELGIERIRRSVVIRTEHFQEES